jgi:hypothetical protein
MEQPALVRHDENDIWEKLDPHSHAFKNLKASRRSQRLGELLGLGDVSQARECLSCHGTDASAAPGALEFAINNDGVSCVACHGKSQKWIEEHALGDSAPWMALSASDKSGLGMNDLRDPVRRTQICLSCHVGNPSEGKVLTHAIYAAGHPPLRSVDVADFSGRMPKHWLDPAEIPYIRQASPEIQRKGYHYVPGEMWRTRQSVAAATATMRELVAFMTSPAVGDGARENSTLGPRDFARFDCAACHHELQARNGASSRQLHGFPATPGRPVTPAWASSLVGLADEASGAQFESQRADILRAFQNAVGARPFGDSVRMRETGLRLVEVSERTLDALRSAKIDRALAQRLLHRLRTQAVDGFPDYESARQMTWALRAITSDLDPEFGRRPDVRPILDALNTQLDLTAAAGIERDLDRALEARLAVQADYDADLFRTRFVELTDRLLGTPNATR